MKVPQFDLGADDETALELCRSFLTDLVGGGVRISTVAVVRWAIHRAAAGVAASLTEAREEEGAESGR